MPASFDESVLALDRQLIQVVYRSRSLIDSAAYDQLLSTCLVNNPRRGITGLLVTHAGWFLQVLEGGAAEVNALLKKIEADPRHSDFLVLRLAAIPKRDFGDWSMASVAVDERRFLELAEDALRAEGAMMSMVRDFLCYGRWGPNPG
ncbi:MAG: BLUF domain-containing protein [Rubrivivax sp.]